MAGIEFVEVVEAGPGWTKVLASDGNTYTLRGNRNWRNNNPGNVEFGPRARSMGAIGTDGRFAVFPTFEMGQRAREELQFGTPFYLNADTAERWDHTYPKGSVGAAIYQYAPPRNARGEFENDTELYIRIVTEAAGVPADTLMRDLMPAQRRRFMDAQMRHEGFKPGKIAGEEGKPVPAAVAQQFSAVPLPPTDIPGSQAPGSPSSYTIRRGDTLGAIATRYGTTIDELATLNGIADPNRIPAGRTLKLPGAPETGDPAAVDNRSFQERLSEIVERASGVPHPRRRPEGAPEAQSPTLAPETAVVPLDLSIRPPLVAPMPQPAGAGDAARAHDMHVNLPPMRTFSAPPRNFNPVGQGARREDMIPPGLFAPLRAPAPLAVPANLTGEPATLLPLPPSGFIQGQPVPLPVEAPQPMPATARPTQHDPVVGASALLRANLNVANRDIREAAAEAARAVPSEGMRPDQGTRAEIGRGDWTEFFEDLQRRAGKTEPRPEPAIAAGGDSLVERTYAPPPRRLAAPARTPPSRGAALAREASTGIMEAADEAWDTTEESVLPGGGVLRIAPELPPQLAPTLPPNVRPNVPEVGSWLPEFTTAKPAGAARGVQSAADATWDRVPTPPSALPTGPDRRGRPSGAARRQLSAPALPSSANLRGGNIQMRPAVLRAPARPAATPKSPAQAMVEGLTKVLSGDINLQMVRPMSPSGQYDLANQGGFSRYDPSMIPNLPEGARLASNGYIYQPNESGGFTRIGTVSAPTMPASSSSASGGENWLRSVTDPMYR